MNDNKLEPVCQPGEDFLDKLTVRELAIVGRNVKADPVLVVSSEEDGGHPLRWEAMARCGHLLDKRRNPTAQLDTWLDLPLSELLDALAIDPDSATQAARVELERQADDESPTGPAPAP